MTYPASYGLNQQIRRVLYALKRQYGGSIVIYQNGVVTADAKTGEVARTKTATRIQRAVILPVKISAEVKHTVALISANKQMLTGAGGGFETGQRLFIIERRDCPNLVLHKTDWVGYNGRKYAIENYEAYEFGAAYLITGKELPAEPLGVAGSIVDLSAADALALDSRAGGES
jgi:hypothetical protein